MSGEQSENRPDVHRCVMWQRLDTPGIEVCSLESLPNDQVPHALFGHVLVALDEAPAAYWYTVYCDAAWTTKSVLVRPFILPADLGKPDLSLHFERGHWFIRKWPESAEARPVASDRELPELSGCIDVDLGISPSTNTLPIRRLNLAVGESRELTAAWVRFPELTVEPLAQRYTRLAERRYRYESVVSGFTAELEVDDLGLVVTYEGIWQRVAESREH